MRMKSAFTLVLLTESQIIRTHTFLKMLVHCIKYALNFKTENIDEMVTVFFIVQNMVCASC